MSGTFLITFKTLWNNSRTLRRLWPLLMLVLTTSHRLLCVSSAQPMLANTRRAVFEKWRNSLVSNLCHCALSAQSAETPIDTPSEMAVDSPSVGCLGTRLPASLSWRYVALWWRVRGVYPQANDIRSGLIKKQGCKDDEYRKYFVPLHPEIMVNHG